MAKPAPATPQAETKAKKPARDPQVVIRQLASTRIPKAVSAIRLVGNLASYKPTKPQMDLIFKTIHEEVAAAIKRFDDAIAGKTPTKEKPTFSL